MAKERGHGWPTTTHIGHRLHEPLVSTLPANGKIVDMRRGLCLEARGKGLHVGPTAGGDGTTTMRGENLLFRRALKQIYSNKLVFSNFDHVDMGNTKSL